MTSDQRLTALARKLGQLLKSYGGDMDGHTALEISRAFTEGFSGKPAKEIEIDLPISDAQYALPDPSAFEAQKSLRLEIAGHAVILSLIETGSPYIPVSNKIPFHAVHLATSDGQLKVGIHQGQLRPAHTFLVETRRKVD